MCDDASGHTFNELTFDLDIWLVFQLDPIKITFTDQGHRSKFTITG